VQAQDIGEGTREDGDDGQLARSEEGSDRRPDDPQPDGRERQLFALLYDLNQQMTSGASLDELLPQVTEGARRLACADHCALLLLDDERRLFTCEATPDSQYGDHHRLQLDQRPVDWVLRHSRPMLVEDMNTDTRFRDPEAAASCESPTNHPQQARSLCCVPLMARDGVIGVVHVAASKAGHFGAQDQQLLSILAAVVAKDVDNARLYRMAVTDRLTGAYNRQFLADRLPTEIERHRRYGQALSILIIDIDHFKKVNDTWGHQAGDLVLVELSQRLREMVREVDSVVRYGGEEFLVVLPSTDLDGARMLAERLLEEVARRAICLPEGKIMITVSGGAAELTLADPDASALVARADALLYQAKASGRNCILTSKAFL